MEVIIMGGSKATSDYRRRRKLNLIKVCGNKCNICGYDKTPDALEFHHIIPENKSYGIANKGTCHDLETDLKEVQKTILVCANCHREIHAGFFTREELENYKIYDENIAQSLREEKELLNQKTIYYCKNCGKPLSGKTITNLCENCYKISRRVCERPSREELKSLIRTTSFTQIGKIYGVSDNAIRKWCENDNLPRKVSAIKKYSDEEWSQV